MWKRPLDRRLEPKAPDGKIRLIGTEHGQDFFIADCDAKLDKQEVSKIADQHRGVGIDIHGYDSDGELVFSF